MRQFFGNYRLDEVVSDSSNHPEVVLEEEQVHELDSSEHDSFLLGITSRPGESVLVGHVTAFIYQPIVDFVEFSGLAFSVDHVEA